MKRGFTAFLLVGFLTSSAALAEPDARTVYEVEKPQIPYMMEPPIAKGTLSSKIFTDSLVLEEGSEKLKYLSAEERKEAERKTILMAKKEEPAKPAPQPVEVVKKEDYPSGTIILLDKTVIKPDQKEIKIAKTTKEPAKKVAKASKKAAVKVVSVDVPKVHISYIADESEVLGATRKKLLQFVRNLRKHGSAKVKVTTASVPLPLQEEDMLAETRIKYIKAFMREQGVNPEQYEFIPTHKKSTKPSDQYLQLEILS